MGFKVKLPNPVTIAKRDPISNAIMTKDPIAAASVKKSGAAPTPPPKNSLPTGPIKSDEGSVQADGSTVSSAISKKYGLPEGFGGLSSFLNKSLWGDINKGQEWSGGFFGANNPEMQAIIEQRKKRALGLNGDEIALMRSRGNEGINRGLDTNLRQLRSGQAVNGIRGGAALGQNLSALSGATQARAGLERDISLADMDRRSTELNGLESTLTGERAGMLGTTMGIAGLGSQNRYGALEYLKADENLKAALAALGLGGLGAGGKPVTPQTLAMSAAQNIAKGKGATGQGMTPSPAGPNAQEEERKKHKWYEPQAWNWSM